MDENQMEEPALSVAGMDDETADLVTREMARRVAWGLPAVPNDDWND